MNFAVIGVAGYIAVKHLDAIRDTNNTILAALDIKDSVGILDRYSLDVDFFTDEYSFEQYLKRKNDKFMSDDHRVHYISICSPNYLHYQHCLLALYSGTNAICEKPLVMHPDQLKELEEAEEETGRRINVIQQLRLHPKILELRENLLLSPLNHRHKVCLTYVAARGKWYSASWKSSIEKSGGVLYNMGVHFFDLLLWLFGDAIDHRVYYVDSKHISGFVALEHADVQWFFSVDASDLPNFVKAKNGISYRSMLINEEEVDFSENTAGLHTESYRQILQSRGTRIKDIKPTIDLLYQIQNAHISTFDTNTHPMVLEHS